MNKNTNRPRPRSGPVRRAFARLEQHLRLQRELLWHPRLGLVGTRQPIAVRAGREDGRRSAS